MSRYDGLIIPRSYSEYINKTDAATLQQALQLSGVLSGAVAAGDNKAVKSSAVNAALINKADLKIVIKTNANECLPNGYNEESFFVGAGGSNIPVNTNFVIKAMRIGNDSETRRYHQIAYKVADGALTNAIYTRVGIKGAPDPTVVWSNWEKLVTESKFKTKQITDTTSANGNINFLLAGNNTVVVGVQSYNDEGFENDTIIIPFKLGDNKPDGGAGPQSAGRWGGHCVTSNGAMTVKANTLIHCTIHYYEI